MESTALNPETAAPFIDMDDYVSIVTDDLKVIGTEDKEAFLKDYLNNEALRQEYKLMGTHSGAFHCDEVMASTLLLRTEEFKKSIIVRTRDDEILKQLDVLYDVGGEFDVPTKRFDHHQKPFKAHFYDEENEKIKQEMEQIKQEAIKNGVAEDAIDYKGLKEHKKISKMSSAGLVYKYYGKEVIRNVCKTVYKQNLEESDIDRIFNKLYNSLMLELDAIDNGVNQGQNLAYEVGSGLSARISFYNEAWNAPKSGASVQHS